MMIEQIPMFVMLRRRRPAARGSCHAIRAEIFCAVEKPGRGLKLITCAKHPKSFKTALQQLGFALQIGQYVKFDAVHLIMRRGSDRDVKGRLARRDNARKQAQFRIVPTTLFQLPDRCQLIVVRSFRP
jgi:hypothetical protein